MLLLAVAFVASRLFPRRRLPWMVPLVLIGVVLSVRTVTYLANR